jgi:NADPH:quinone reductase
MKSVMIRTVGGPEVLEIVDGPVPEPRAHELVIHTRAMAVSTPDILIRKGLYTWSPPLPANPGNELAGVVAAIGSAVTDFRLGQHVLLSARELSVRGGCYTEMIAVPAASVHLLPDSVEFQQAAVVPTYVVAYAMLFGLEIARRAQSIFVTGAAGAVASAIADLARAHGIRVIGSVSTPQKAAFAQSMGVSDIVFRPENLLARVMELTGGRGVDAAFDHVIGPGFKDCVHMLADFGTAVAYNVYSPMPDTDIFGELRKLSKASLGVRVFNMHSYDNNQAALRQITSAVIQLLATQKITPRIGATFRLSEVADAHRLLESGQALGKIVLTAGDPQAR